MVTDPDGNVTTYTYDNIGNRKTVTYPNSTQASYVYDSLNRLTYLENRDLTLNSVISSYAYDLGPAGNRLAVTENSGRRVEYAYDDIYRLVEESIFDDGVTLSDDIAYTYDAVGNRLSKTDNGGTIAYAYDDNDRLLSAGGTTFTYDPNGNPLSKTSASGPVSYAYDYDNRLIEVDDSVNGLSSYTYDPQGNRLSKTDSTGATSYLVDTNRAYAQVLQETAPDSSLTTYVYGDDLISQNRAGVSSYYHYDGNMSTRQLTDTGGYTTDTYTYDAFGNLLASTGSTPNNYFYTGEQYDPNAGFYYLRARYYNPEIGRFTNRDIYTGSPFEPQSSNRYSYGYNNPVTNLDPSGHLATRTLIGLTIAASIIVILAGLQCHRLFPSDKRMTRAFNNNAFNRTVEIKIEEALLVDPAQLDLTRTSHTGTVRTGGRVRAGCDQWLLYWLTEIYHAALKDIGTNGWRLSVSTFPEPAKYVTALTTQVYSSDHHRPALLRDIAGISICPWTNDFDIPSLMNDYLITTYDKRSAEVAYKPINEHVEAVQSAWGYGKIYTRARLSANVIGHEVGHNFGAKDNYGDLRAPKNIMGWTADDLSPYQTNLRFMKRDLDRMSLYLYRNRNNRQRYYP